MIWVYDKAIVKDLEQSFASEEGAPVVKIVDPEHIVELAAQIQEDSVKFPIVALSRPDNWKLDKERMNFTRMHKGVTALLDEKTNNLYYEKAVPIDLRYDLTVLTTNTPDMDEILRELIFKYISMYFLTVKLPYEGKRKIRFGIGIDPDSNIDSDSKEGDYLGSGKLHQSTIHLKCDGCVLVHYTPAHLVKHELEAEVDI